MDGWVTEFQGPFNSISVIMSLEHGSEDYYICM